MSLYQSLRSNLCAK